jgi:hypothetical protein
VSIFKIASKAEAVHPRGWLSPQSGYRLWFQQEEDREAFDGYSFYLLQPNRGKTDNKKRGWRMVERCSGQVFLVPASMTNFKTIWNDRQLPEVWPQYRLLIALKILLLSPAGADIPPNLAALIAQARFEGITVNDKHATLKQRFY